MLRIINEMTALDFAIMILFIGIGLTIAFIFFRRKSIGVNKIGLRFKRKYPPTFNVILTVQFIVWLYSMCHYISKLEELSR
ncbi:hypothetical protein [Aquimarina algiphila]|uniref:hypothetical protein n=1 Tax=Aquimarina algiphila TaxID=2047982 RepID=UPI002490D525|nr:hypothetical protein [Aquimarina algiphila]